MLHKQLGLLLLQMIAVELQYIPPAEHGGERRPVDCCRTLTEPCHSFLLLFEYYEKHCR